jgi:hypothetical protein
MHKGASNIMRYGPRQHLQQRAGGSGITGCDGTQYDISVSETRHTYIEGYHGDYATSTTECTMRAAVSLGLGCYCYRSFHIGDGW